MADKMPERDKLLIMQEKITTPHNIVFQSSHSLSAAHPSSALANRASAHGMSERLKALRRLKHGNVMWHCQQPKAGLQNARPTFQRRLKQFPLYTDAAAEIESRRLVNSAAYMVYRGNCVRVLGSKAGTHRNIRQSTHPSFKSIDREKSVPVIGSRGHFKNSFSKVSLRQKQLG